MEQKRELIKEFFSKVSSDDALQEQLRAAAGLPETEALKKIAQLATETGYAVTAADLLELSRESANQMTVIEDGAMTDEQLAAVAGGVCWTKSCWSKIKDACVLLYTIPDTNEGQGCFYVYGCTDRKNW